MNTVYTIVRNETNEVIFITNSYNNIKEYVMKHFSKYTIYQKDELISIESKRFTLNKYIMNYDYLFDEEYK